MPVCASSPVLQEAVLYRCFSTTFSNASVLAMLAMLKSLLQTAGDETSRGHMETFLNATSNGAAVVFANCAESRD